MQTRWALDSVLVRSWFVYGRQDFPPTHKEKWLKFRIWGRQYKVKLGALPCQVPRDPVSFHISTLPAPKHTPQPLGPRLSCGHPIHVPSSGMGGDGGEWNVASLLRKYPGGCHQKLPFTFDWPELGYVVKIQLPRSPGNVFFAWTAKCPVQTSVTVGKKSTDIGVQQALQQQSQVLQAKHCTRPVLLTINVM